MMNRDCQELPIFPYDGELDQRPGEENNGQIVESTPSRPRRYYLARIANAGSVPYSATKISDKYPILISISVFFGTACVRRRTVRNAAHET